MILFPDSKEGSRKYLMQSNGKALSLTCLQVIFLKGPEKPMGTLLEDKVGLAIHLQRKVPR